MAINDPFDAPELALLYCLTRRALRDRQVLTPETMTDQDLQAFRDAMVAMGEPDPSIDE